jgi:hypothetical protein
MNPRDQIIQAFSQTPPPSGKITDTYDDEGVAAYFTGKTWRGHSVRDLLYYSCALSFFEPEAFRYYLPAFMLAELDEPEKADIIAESILFSLADSEHQIESLYLMTNQEREAVASFFEECAKRHRSEDFKAGAWWVRNLMS